MIEEVKTISTEDKGLKRSYFVHSIRNLTDTTYVIRFDRNNMDFIPGQHLSVGLANDPQAREYSIYSSITDDYLEIIVKEVEDGVVSKKLKKVKAGQELRVTGPMGFFKLDTDKINTHQHLFIATGTGISPFHSFVKSFPELNYRLIHGVRFVNEAYEREHYPKNRYTLCTSRDQKGDFKSHTTNYLKTQKIDANTMVYLCGNCDMIFEAYDILTDKGVPTENIHTEVYF